MMSIDNTVIARTTRFPFPCASVPSVDKMHFILTNSVRYSWSVASIKRSLVMNIGHVNPELAARLPLPRITEICQRYGVSELSVYGPILESDVQKDVLVEFLDDDFGLGVASSIRLRTTCPATYIAKCTSRPERVRPVGKVRSAMNHSRSPTGTLRTAMDQVGRGE
jgi:hypothetical protein